MRFIFNLKCFEPMKKILALIPFLLCIYSLSIFAQSEGELTEGATFKYSVNKTMHQMPDSIMVFGTIKGKTTETLIVEKSVYSRDKYENQTKEIRYRVNKDHQLVPYRRILSQYDLEGRKTEKLLAKWDSTSNSYIENRKIVYQYPVNDICIETYYSLRNNNWEATDSTKSVSTFNGNQDPVETIFLEYQNNKWTNTSRVEFRYDGDYRILDKVYYQWINDAWEINYKNIYSYDIDPKRASVKKVDMSKTYPVEDNFGITPQGFPYTIKEVMDFSMVIKSTIPTIKTVVNEQPKTTVENKTSKPPKNQGFYINAGEDEATVSVFSLNGELLLTKQITGTKFIRMNSLSKGTYLVKITIDDNTVTRKLVLN